MLFPLLITTYTISYHHLQTVFVRFPFLVFFFAVTHLLRWHDNNDTINPKLGLVEVSLLNTEFYPKSFCITSREKWDHQHFLHILRGIHVDAQPQIHTHTYNHSYSHWLIVLSTPPILSKWELCFTAKAHDLSLTLFTISPQALWWQYIIQPTRKLKIVLKKETIEKQNEQKENPWWFFFCKTWWTWTKRWDNECSEED